MEQKFRDDGRVFLVLMPDIDSFTTTFSFDNTKHVITLLSNNSCMKYLDIQSIPSGNQESQFKSLIQINKTCARTLDTNPFGRHHTKKNLRTHLNAKLYYSFTYSSLTSKQYISINKHHIASDFSSMGFNKYQTLSLRYGCHSYGGLQLQHSQVEALIKSINSIQSILPKPDTVTSFHITITQFQLIAGISYPILENPNHSLNHVTSIWSKGFIRLLNIYNFKLKMKFTYCTLHLRENDSFLVNCIYSIVSSNSDLEKLNACRLYLNILLLSDIININGNSIILGILPGDKSNIPPSTFY